MQRYKNFLNRARILSIKKMNARIWGKSCKVANCMRFFFEEGEKFMLI